MKVHWRMGMMQRRSAMRRIGCRANLCTVNRVTPILNPARQVATRDLQQRELRITVLPAPLVTPCCTGASAPVRAHCAGTRAAPGRERPPVGCEWDAAAALRCRLSPHTRAFHRSSLPAARTRPPPPLWGGRSGRAADGFPTRATARPGRSEEHRLQRAGLSDLSRPNPTRLKRRPLRLRVPGLPSESSESGSSSRGALVGES